MISDGRGARCDGRERSQPRFHDLEVFLFDCECLGEWFRELALPRELSELPEKLPTGVIREFGCQHGIERLRKSRTRICYHLQQSTRRNGSDIRTWRRHCGVAANLLYALSQHSKVLQLLGPNASQRLECGFPIFTGWKRNLTGVCQREILGDHRAVEPRTRTLEGDSVAQLIEQSAHRGGCRSALG